MKVFIKNKLISIGEGSKIFDENKQPVFNVKGKLFSITKKKFINDLNGNLLYMVRNKWFTWIRHSALIYDANKNKVAKVTMKFWTHKFIVSDYTDEIVIDGKFWGNVSTILKNGEPIGEIRRKFDLLVDSFSLEADEADMAFLVALVIAIDNITDDRARR